LNGGELSGNIIQLIQTVAIIMVAAYGIFYTGLSKALFEGKIDRKSRTILILVFGLFSIYGTLGGVKIGDAVSNIRDLGPLIAGLLAGPVVGLGAGSIGGIHRYFMGGFTAVPCSIATIIAGLLGGMVNIYLRGKFLRIVPAMLLAALMEAFHMAITLLLARPFEQALQIVSIVSIPMILTNALGIGIFGFIFFNLKKEKENIITRERLEGELQVARSIQLSMIPEGVPSRPGKKEGLDTHALFKPAWEVGGDLYDWMYLDENHFAFMIGDAAGKGIPASLFMAVARTLIHSHCKVERTPGDILSIVNKELCQDNNTSMFITLFMGIMDITTGQIAYTNAGHPSPYIVKPKNSAYCLPQAKNPALGVWEAATYETFTAFLRTGETLLLYTDGVTEATNSKKEFYTQPRLDRVLSAIPPANTVSAKSICDYVIEDLHEFVGASDQADDITMLAVNAPQVSSTLKENVGEILHV
jgi:sigma-B regulation protein RsbU (phosphoserine phosphatase)